VRSHRDGWSARNREQRNWQSINNEPDDLVELVGLLLSLAQIRLTDLGLERVRECIPDLECRI